MIRSCFFASGMFLLMWGVSFLLVDKMVLNWKDEGPPPAPGSFRGLFTTVNANQQQVLDPPEWAAFTLLSIGSVTMLYSAALPRRGNN